MHSLSYSQLDDAVLDLHKGILAVQTEGWEIHLSFDFLAHTF